MDISSKFKLEGITAMAVNIAAQHCRHSPDGHVTLATFRMLRTNPACLKTYLSATGAMTGYEKGHAGKHLVNKAIGKAIARHFNADVIEVVNYVEGEFIVSYSVLAIPHWKAN